MQKIKLIILFVSISLTIAYSSCKNNEEKKSSIYHCPMDCEGDKNYSMPGNCPVCKMELEEIEKKDSTVIDSLNKENKHSENENKK